MTQHQLHSMGNFGAISSSWDKLTPEWLQLGPAVQVNHATRTQIGRQTPTELDSMRQQLLQLETARTAIRGNNKMAQAELDYLLQHYTAVASLPASGVSNAATQLAAQDLAEQRALTEQLEAQLKSNYAQARQLQHSIQQGLHLAIQQLSGLFDQGLRSVGWQNQNRGQWQAYVSLEPNCSPDQAEWLEQQVAAMVFTHREHWKMLPQLQSRYCGLYVTGQGIRYVAGGFAV